MNKLIVFKLSRRSSWEIKEKEGKLGALTQNNTSLL